MFYWIYDISTVWLAVLMAVVFVGFSWLGCLFVRPVLHKRVTFERDKNEILGAILSCFGVFYGLLLGLIAVGVWENFSEVEDTTHKEAAAIDALYHDVSVYPEPYGQNLRWLLRDYCRYEIKYGWPAQRNGIIPEGGSTRVRSFQERLLTFQPRNTTEQVVHAETLREFNVFLEHRRHRLNATRTGIPAVMWYVVIIGAVINIGMLWLFDMRLLSHLFLGGLLAFFLSMMILLIAALDNPFRGEFSVTFEALEDVHRIMMQQ
jgi:hypothetical protein